MKMISRKRALVAVSLTAAISFVSGIISGHATAMHEHADMEDTMQTCTENGIFSYRKYFKAIINDYKNMLEDPLGLKRSR